MAVQLLLQVSQLRIFMAYCVEYHKFGFQIAQTLKWLAQTSLRRIESIDFHSRSPIQSKNPSIIKFLSYLNKIPRYLRQPPRERHLADILNSLILRRLINQWLSIHQKIITNVARNNCYWQS